MHAGEMSPAGHRHRPGDEARHDPRQMSEGDHHLFAVVGEMGGDLCCHSSAPRPRRPFRPWRRVRYAALCETLPGKVSRPSVVGMNGLANTPVAQITFGASGLPIREIDLPHPPPRAQFATRAPPDQPDRGFQAEFLRIGDEVLLDRPTSRKIRRSRLQRHPRTCGSLTERFVHLVQIDRRWRRAPLPCSPWPGFDRIER